MTKNRRIAIISFVLVAILLLGIGFAQLTDVLTIGGTAGVDADNSQEVFDGDVYFSNAVANIERVTASIDATDKDVATMTVKDNVLKEVGDEAIATFTVKSESDLPVYLTPSVTNSNPEYFNVYTTWDTTKTLQPGQTVDITVTVKLAKTAVADQAATFTVTIDASTTAPTQN